MALSYCLGGAWYRDPIDWPGGILAAPALMGNGASESGYAILSEELSFCADAFGSDGAVNWSVFRGISEGVPYVGKGDRWGYVYGEGPWGSPAGLLFPYSYGPWLPHNDPLTEGPVTIDQDPYNITSASNVSGQMSPLGHATFDYGWVFSTGFNIKYRLTGRYSVRWTVTYTNTAPDTHLSMRFERAYAGGDQFYPLEITSTPLTVEFDAYGDVDLAGSGATEAFFFNGFTMGAGTLNIMSSSVELSFGPTEDPLVPAYPAPPGPGSVLSKLHFMPNA